MFWEDTTGVALNELVEGLMGDGPLLDGSTNAVANSIGYGATTSSDSV